MKPRSPTALLVRDELIGFARSKVMLVLWVILPILAIGGYFLLTGRALESAADGQAVSATTFMSFLLSSLSGTIAALMVAVDIVSERQRKVYELFVIRPIRREAIIWAKFIAVFACVAVACVVSLSLGIGVDAIRGAPPTPAAARELGRSLVSLIGVISLSAAVGVLVGVLARSILVAVILILYVGQNLTIIPMLPMYLGVLPDHFWLLMLITYALVGALLWIATTMFRRAEF